MLSKGKVPKASSPLLNIQSEPDYSSSEESESINDPLNDLNIRNFDSLDPETVIKNNIGNNTFFSNIFKKEKKLKNLNINNPQDSDLLLLKSVDQRNEANVSTFRNENLRSAFNHHKIDEQRGIQSEPSSAESNDELEEGETESIRLFRDNAHFLEEQPVSVAMFSEHEEENEVDSDMDASKTNTFNIADIDKKQLTLWRFSNIDNLDSFFITFYKYYLKKGLYSYLIEKIVNILILLFVMYLSISLKYCINYQLFSNATRLEDIWMDKCFKVQLPFTVKLIIWLVYCFIFLKIKAVYKEFKSLQLMQSFYYYLLDIDDEELQIISWVEILKRLIKFKDSNNLFQNSDNITFENIVNRIMRLDNYLIAVYSNESLMKFKVFNNRYQVSLTKSLEWNINLILINFFFDNGQFAVNRSKNASTMLELDLINKFRVAGFINIVLTPFLVVYFSLLYILKYFYNIKSIFNLREYNLENKYKLREYNELEHFFNKRLNLSIDIANEYLLQFPNNINNLVYKFLAFISGSLLAILTITTLIFDSENFLSFEITNNRSILFYISIIGAINTFTYNNIQQDKYKTYQPKKYFKELSKYTHFRPKPSVVLHEKMLSNVETRDEFVKIYSLKLINILNEFGSLLLTPYILWFVLPKRSKKIILFMQEITEKDHELGYICKYANYKPSKEEFKQSFFYMEDEDKDQDIVPPVDVEELKFDKKRRIKDRLLRSKISNLENKRNSKDNHIDNSNKNLKPNKKTQRRQFYNFEFGSFDSNQDKMKRSFMQFHQVYHDDN
ncbi:hypothetical protein QEN19_001542 [Hanseniaspora menglaensis]